MRFAWKLLLLVTIGVGAQLLIERNEAEIDDAQFAARCFVAKMCGAENNDPQILREADALVARHLKRLARDVAAAGHATTRPAQAGGASAADELQWSLCDGAP